MLTSYIIDIIHRDEIVGYRVVVTNCCYTILRVSGCRSEWSLFGMMNDVLFSFYACASVINRQSMTKHCAFSFFFINK